MLCETHRCYNSMYSISHPANSHSCQGCKILHNYACSVTLNVRVCGTYYYYARTSGRTFLSLMWRNVMRALARTRVVYVCDSRVLQFNGLHILRMSCIFSFFGGVRAARLVGFCLGAGHPE